jgi:hypothetical protein
VSEISSSSASTHHDWGACDSKFEIKNWVVFRGVFGVANLRGKPKPTIAGPEVLFVVIVKFRLFFETVLKDFLRTCCREAEHRRTRLTYFLAEPVEVFILEGFAGGVSCLAFV